MARQRPDRPDRPSPAPTAFEAKSALVESEPTPIAVVSALVDAVEADSLPADFSLPEDSLEANAVTDLADPEQALTAVQPAVVRRTAATAGFSGFLKEIVAAPVGSKIVMPHGGVLTFAGPDGAREDRLDPAARFLPAGAWVRKVAPDTYVGHLPAGSAARSPHAWDGAMESVQELAETMRRVLKGEE